MFASIIAAVAVTYLFGSWMYGASLAVLILIWRGFPDTEGPPVLQLAMTCQWGQVSVGLWYYALTGRGLPVMEVSTYEMMVGVGLGCIALMTLGMIAGIRVMQKQPAEHLAGAPEYMVTFRTLLIVYVSALAATGALTELAYQLPGIGQALVAISVARLGVVALILRRIVRPVFRWELITVLLAFETVIGFTGYFSGFKEPMLLAALALFEVFDRRRVGHWVTAGSLALGLGMAFVMWIGVRDQYRRDFVDDASFASSRSARLERMQALFTDWFAQREDRFTGDTDKLVDRAWVIYYPALALERVPSVLAHTNGEIMETALLHLVTPRLLFPNKPGLVSDSLKVRRYSGVWVAGAEENTSIAFGFAAESYVDYGLPWMFIPMFVFGLLMGVTYEWFLRLIHHRELAVALVMCLFWVNLYLFERSWAKMLGTTLTMFITVGGLAYVFDRWLILRQQHRFESDVSTDPAYLR
ncbi:MAG: hypothetical protein FJW23_10455 [Acidimicrobiia bacterium]|nr:hypothetical protein [Acidimicrobiia bacterium]